MWQIKFIAKATLKMDVKKRLVDVCQVSAQTGKCKAAVLADMLVCTFKYGAGPADYRLFELYSKTPQQRATYITRGMNNHLVKKYNNADHYPKIDNKKEFYHEFAKYTKRDWLPLDGLTPEALERFCAGKERVLYKPSCGSCGKGIEMINLAEWKVDMLYAYLKEKPDGLLDEAICQHPDMARIYDKAVNTVRVVTIRKDGVTTPVFAFLRMGTGGKVVDNLNSDGVAAKLELSDGSITLPAAGKDGRLHSCHPETGTQIIGFTVPHWEQVLQLAKDASAVVPQIGYVGWDIAVRTQDVVLIEGNGYPGHDILQLPAYTPDNFGLKSSIEAFL